MVLETKNIKKCLVISDAIRNIAMPTSRIAYAIRKYIRIALSSSHEKSTDRTNIDKNRECVQ